MPVAFRPIKTADMVRAYPFVKEPLDIGDTSDDVKPFPPQVLIAEVRNAATKISFLFIYHRDRNHCDASGCAYYVFADRGGGYKQVNGGMSAGPIYLLNGRDMVACTTNNKGNKLAPEWWSLRREWWMQGDPGFASNGAFVSTPPLSCGMN